MNAKLAPKAEHSGIRKHRARGGVCVKHLGVEQFKQMPTLTVAKYDVWCMSTALSHRVINTALWKEQMFDIKAFTINQPALTLCEGSDKEAIPLT